LVHGLPCDPLQACKETLAEGTFAGDPDLLLGDYVKGPLEALPLALLDLLTDYRIVRSKFYNGGYGGLVEEYLPKSLAGVDEHLVRARGSGVFRAFRPGSSTRLRRYPYQSAVYGGPAREITVATVIPYSRHVPLRAFLNAVVKHTENKLRELTGFRGRLRGYALEPDVRDTIDGFIAASSLAIVPPPPPPMVVLDVERLRDLARESHQVRVLLGAATAEAPEPEPQPDHAQPEPHDTPAVVRPDGIPDHLLTDLEPVHRILTGLGADEIGLLNVLRAQAWEADAGTVAAAMPGAFVEPLVDRVNALALDELGDILVADEGEAKVVAEDYRDELEYLLEQRDAVVAASPAPEGADDLPEEWAELLAGLAEPHRAALRAILEHQDPTGELARIAAEHVTMPELLVDSINEVAVATIGDVIIEPGSVPPVVE